jgi:23S rRNA (guanosine2251-2'-O)-methyltransferase
MMKIRASVFGRCLLQKLTYDEIQKKRLTQEAARASQKRLPVIAILEDIRSLYNVGSIFRTSDGAHIERLITVGYTPSPAAESERARREVAKTALGATETVPHEHFATIEEAVQSLSGYKIAALEIAANSRSVFSLAANDFPLALIVGNEITGVSDRALALCDMAVEIPMLGAKHSLNVAVAYGVAVFECMRALSLSKK